MTFQLTYLKNDVIIILYNYHYRVIITILQPSYDVTILGYVGIMLIYWQLLTAVNHLLNT